MAASQFTVYRSTDTGAPVLDGQAGSFLNCLDAILVGTAGYAYGTTPTAGWSAYIARAANQAAYRAPSGTQMIIRVRDDAPDTGNGNEARICSYEALTGLPDTGGTNRNPTGTDVLILKQNAAGTTTSEWVCYADARTFIFCPLPGVTFGIYYPIYIGEIYSMKSTADNYNCIVIGRTTAKSTSINYEWLSVMGVASAAVSGHFIQRTYAGSGSSIAVGKFGDSGKNNLGSGSSTMADGGVNTWADAACGSIFLSPFYVYEPSTTVPVLRGKLRGLYHVVSLQNAGLSDGMVLYGANEFEGRTFRILHATQTPSGATQTLALAIETSNTVETN